MVTESGDFVIVGNGSSYTYSYIPIYKISPNGDIIWETTIQDTFSFHARAMSVSVDGFIYISGHKRNKNGSQHVWLAKINSDGSLLWSRTYQNYATTIDMTLENGMYPILLTRKHWNDAPAFGLMKMDQNGLVIIDRTTPMDTEMYFKPILPVTSGYIVAGNYSSGEGTGEHTALFHFDQQLGIDAFVRLDSISVKSICAVNDSVFAMTGISFIRANYNTADYLLKTMYLDYQFRKINNNNCSVVIHHPDLINSTIINQNNEVLMAGLWSWEWPCIMKFNSQGEWLWSKFLFRTGSSKNITPIRKNIDGNYFIVTDYENKISHGFIILIFTDDGNFM